MNKENKTVVMTDEQRTLIEDNINLIYKFCVTNNLNDEDSKQEMICHICSNIHSYDPEKGAFSTWVYKALTTKMWRMSEKKYKSLESLAVSLDEKMGDEEDTELYELVGDDDLMFDSIIDNEAYAQILKEYKRFYPETWERDIGIVQDIVLNKDKMEIAKKYHVAFYAISHIFKTVITFFRTYANGEGVPMKLESTDQLKDKSEVQLNEDEYYRLINWIKKGFKAVKCRVNYRYGSFVLSEFASKELGFNVTNATFKRAMYACGYKPPKKDESNSVWVFCVSNNSPAIERLKRSRSKNEIISRTV